MSRSSIVKKEILEILKDGQQHSACEIKEKIKKIHLGFEVTEGIFSNAFRTLTLAGKISNIERGIYCLNSEICKTNNNENKENKTNNSASKEIQDNENKIIECSKTKKYMELQDKISNSMNQMREELAKLVSDVNIMEADDETVSYILNVRKALVELENKIKGNQYR